MIKAFKAKLDDNLINQIAENWIIEYGKKRTKIRKVKIIELATYYLNRHPTEPKHSACNVLEAVEEQSH